MILKLCFVHELIKASMVMERDQGFTGYQKLIVFFFKNSVTIQGTQQFTIWPNASKNKKGEKETKRKHVKCQGLQGQNKPNPNTS